MLDTLAAYREYKKEVNAKKILKSKISSGDNGLSNEFYEYGGQEIIRMFSNLTLRKKQEYVHTHKK